MLLQMNRILVKEQVGLFKFSDRYDLFDPDSGKQVGICQEHPPWFSHLLRLAINKTMLPTMVEVRQENSNLVLFRIRRGFRLFRSVVQVEDGNGRLLGTLRSKILSFRLEFQVLDSKGSEIAKVSGDWKGWNFQLVGSGGTTLGTIAKKWAGIGKELFTSADNYMIEMAQASPADIGSRSMLLAAALAIDICFKENR
jgi:uncharacterized protein YxjI